MWGSGRAGNALCEAAQVGGTHLSQVSVHEMVDMVCVSQTVLWFVVKHTLSVLFVLFSVYYDVVRLLIIWCGVNRLLLVLLPQLLHWGSFSHALQVLAHCIPPRGAVSTSLQCVHSHQNHCSTSAGVRFVLYMC